MQQQKFVFILLLFASYVTAAEEIEATTEEFDPYAQPDNNEDQENSPCEIEEEFIDGKCVDVCITRNVCGNFTTCQSIGLSVSCSCLKGYTGDPINGCFKMNEENPCNPNPCGENAKCFENDEILGPHCKCLEDYYDWPPNCRWGCKTNYDCTGDSEVCDYQHYCKDLCNPSPCGDNSICRVDKKTARAHCSCKDGYIPQKDAGCRLKTSEDLEIPFSLIESVVKDPCGVKCGQYAYCNHTAGSCVCTQGYSGDPTVSCKKIETPDKVDACNPNPCGGYSECKIVNGEKSCSCADESFGSPPYCFPCYSSVDCGEEMLCVGGRCVINVCQEYCGIKANCNVINGTILECSCSPSAGDSSLNRPFHECISPAHIPPALIGTLLG
ncbi:hypothetical protein PVAND_001412 [Polypedilum vanderplanki]|uniref:EGF-like domain-containing protein n=1 Tax=Polypedilum vanderplanki TaxID=319348 RepID=A0A9J6BP64_POLVA|nr:hypothetical protein PVAND_001412 [Polypedilum vanderplanki]